MKCTQDKELNGYRCSLGLTRFRVDLLVAEFVREQSSPFLIKRGLNGAQMTHVVNALPGVLVAKAVGPSAEVFRVDLDCAKLSALAADQRVESIEAPTS